MMDSDQGKLFIGGISWETSEDKLKEYFGNYGDVLQTVVMRDKASGRPRGFGFVVFADPSILDRVLQDKHIIDGRTVEAKRALSREEQHTSSRIGNFNPGRNPAAGGSIKCKKIFVGGLPPNLTEEGFRQYFEAYGHVTDVVVMYDQTTQRPRGFGFISFDTEDAVDRVLHKTFHDLNGKQVEVKRALPKDANPGGLGRPMGGGAGGGSGGASGGGYQGYGATGGNPSAYDGRMDSNRYLQPQNIPPYGSSGYTAPGYGYGPASNGMGYGGYGSYGGANPGYGGPAGAAYGNPNTPSAGYASGPPGAPRSSWNTQAPSGYGTVGYGNAASWSAASAGGGATSGGPGSAPTGQSPSGAAGYGNQGYGYGNQGYAGSDGSYANAGGYGAVGGRSGSVPNSSASAGGGELQGNAGGGYMGSGFGRLASCFLDSMATLNLPAWGYGLRYRYGLFKQRITKEGQEEIAEDWLEKFSPWEIVRHDVIFPVRFFGHIKVNPNGSRKWIDGEVVQALAYDVPIPGYKTKNTISLRIWEAKAGAEDFNLFQFNDGQYESAAQLHSSAQQICAVLYPGDATESGKLLRLKQQYFLCSASLQDIIFRFKERRDGKGSWNWSDFPSKVAVQLNDTHPTLAVPELMRLLMDDEGLGWDEAWDVTTRTIAYTNHTVLPEALEKWSQVVMWKLLPRHMEIIQEIDKRFIAMVRSTQPDLESKITTLCILDNNPQKPVVRMANLCVVSAHTVNGVAQLHSDILKAELFADYVSIWPTKFQNKTNGITPRRWLKFCSPELSSIITKWLKTDQWVTNLDLLTNLRQFADNAELQAEWASAKMANKNRLAQYILRVTGVTIDPNSLFDIQVKRIHEYKRQLLNILGAIYRYKKLKEMRPEERKNTTPRTIMIGGKAFATYTNAKRIVKLVDDVGSLVNTDPEVNTYLKVVFVPNYNVSVAEILIPGSELSQHISTAGMEASGTSNMKFALNGCLIIGTLDGANVEIREEIGEDNFFLFGATADQVPKLRKDREDGLFEPDPRFEEAKKFIRSGVFGSYDYNPLLDSLEGNSGFGRGDYFLVGHDFPAYMDAQGKVDEAYKDKKQWLKMSILSTAGSGKFSSDRTIAQYAKEIWNIEECCVP